MKKLSLLIGFVFFLFTSNVFATNITINDNNPNNPGNSSWTQADENDETEPGMIQSQIWDLEGFFVEGTELSLVGGYDFVNGAGVVNGSGGFHSGDIFIDVDGNAVYGDIHGITLPNGSTASDGIHTVTNSFGYDYVIDLDWTENSYSYSVFSINAESNVLTAFYAQNQGSSPWRYLSGGTEIVAAAGNIGYETDLSGDEVGISNNGWGGQHNKLTVDLGFLLDDTDDASVTFTAHYTMECGNDNIMGRGTIPNPEPSTMLLLGFGLLAFAKLGRKTL